MNLQKAYRLLLPLTLVVILLLTACGPQPTPTPTIYAPGCSVSNLISYLDGLNSNSPPAVINLDPGCVYTLTQVDNTIDVQTITLHNGLPVISNQVTIYGNNAIIDIQGAVMGHFFIDQTGDLELYDLTLSNGARQFGGAVLNSHGDFFASRTTFLNNVAYPDGDLVGQGGAIYNDSGRARIIDNSHFQENHAGETLTSGFNRGGAIFNFNGALIVSDSSFHQNYAAGQGGAIFSMKSAGDEAGEFIIINEDEFIDNYAFDNGGALMLLDESSTVFIIRSDFESNQADNSGGAIFAEGSNVEETINRFFRNNAIYGGAVYTKRPAEGVDSSYLIYNSAFLHNTATEIGGGFFSENSDITMDHGLFMENTANSCGAFSNGGDPSIDIIAGDLETAPRIASSTQLVETHFYGNDALQSHGGAICHVMGDLSFQDSYLNDNNAVSMGGAVLLLDTNQLSSINVNNNTAERGGGIAIGYPYNYTPGMTLLNYQDLTANTTISGSAINFNVGTLRGGGIWSDHSGSTNISKTTFYNNSTDFTGGGLYKSRGDMSITNSTFSSNYALRGGGIMQILGANHSMTITHTTFANNVAAEEDDGGNEYNQVWGGGAVNISDTLTVENTLFVDNLPMNCQYRNGMSYTFTENYSTDNTCGGTVETNPMIGPLADNGGGTDTHALLPGSPLIDVLSGCAGLIKDQRNITRPKGAACDPGAYEFDPPSPPPMPRTSSCDPFADTEYRLVMLNVAPGSTDLTLYLKVEGGIPSALLPAIQSGKVVTAMLGETEANLCNLQGFEDRIYCMFTLPPSALGAALDLELLHMDCDDPLLFLQGVSIPVPKLVCTENLSQADCEAAGGVYEEGRTASASTCKCP